MHVEALHPADTTGETTLDELVDLATFDTSHFPRRTPSTASAPCRGLLTDSLRHADGLGPAVDISDFRGKLTVLTLDINSVVERTGLTVSVWGSPDRVDWGSQPLITLRQRQYCGVYSALLNLARRPDVRFLRIQWSMSRWGRGEQRAQFGFEVFLEESGARLSAPACA